MICLISCSLRTENNVLTDFLYSDYTRFFERLGIELVPASNLLTDIELYIKRLKIEGIILSGGNDIGSAPSRDRQEKRLLKIAITKRLPVLGICRGMQFINYYFSNRMPLDIKRDILEPIKHVRSSHNADIMNKEWRRLLGKDRIKVNSFHNHGYTENNIAGNLNVLAISGKDGIVEAIAHNDYPIVGIQWHPERKGSSPKTDEKIINSFKKRKSLWSR